MSDVAGACAGSPEAPPSNQSGSEGNLVWRLTGATFNYGIGQVLPQVVGFLLLPVYTAFLSPQEYGVLDIAGASGALLVILMRFGVPGAVTRFYYDHREGEGLTDYVTSTARFMLVSSAIVGVLALVSYPVYGGRWLPGLPFVLVLLVVGASLLSSNSDLQRRLVQAREQSAYSAKLSLAFGLTSAALAVLFVAGFRWGVAGMLAAQAIVAAAFFVQAHFYLRPDLQGAYRPAMVRGSLAYAAGILPHHVISSAAPLVTRSLLANLDSTAAVGMVALASRFTSPLQVATNAFSFAFTPVYFAVRKEETPESLDRLAVTARAVWSAALFGFLAVALLGPPAIRVLTNPRFHAAAPLVPILAAGFLAQILYLLLGTEIFYSKKTWLVPAASLAGAATTVAITVATARRWGPYGMAWATVTGTLVGALVAAAASTRLVTIPHVWWRIALNSLVAAALLGLGSLGPVRPAATQLLVAAAALALFPLILWVAREPALRELATAARRLVTSREGSPR